MATFTKKHSPDKSTKITRTQIVKENMRTYLLIERKISHNVFGGNRIHKIYANYVDSADTWYAHLPRCPGENVKQISEQKLEEKISDCENIKLVASTDEVPARLTDIVEQARVQSDAQSGLNDVNP